MKRTITFTTVLLLILVSLVLNVSAGEKPLIGITYSREQAEKLNAGTDELIHYRNALESNGGAVLVLSPLMNEEELTGALDTINALLLPGGGDVDPKFYNEEPHKTLYGVDADFDRFQFHTLKYANENKLPVLGICRGLQLMNVYFGGTLYQDIPSQYRGPRRVTHRAMGEDKYRVFHMININPYSFLYEAMLQEKRVETNSNHHQSVKRKAKGFDIVARADDETVEAMESNGKVFMLGVQFHPERLLEKDRRFNNIFSRFIREAGKTRRKADR